jgi:Cu(I)/Ag(I) efflux system periplasmic protein CusF
MKKLLALMLLSSAAFAQTTVPMTEGEVRKIDKDAAKITIKHGEIKNLDMPPMTMVFRVKDGGMLDQVKEGDKIKFTADKIGGAFTVTGIEKK